MTNFSFTRKDFFNTILDNPNMMNELAVAFDCDETEVKQFCEHSLEALNKPRKMSDKKLKEREEIDSTVLDTITFDEAMPLAEIASKTEFSTQKIVASINRLIASGIGIEKSIVDKKVAYKRVTA